MTASALCRWHRAWISGASVACLGMSGILCGGCAPLGNDLTSSSSQAKQQQVAGLNSGAANQKMAGSPPQKSTQKESQKVAQKRAAKPAQNVAQKLATKPAAAVAQQPAKKPGLKPTAQLAQSTAGRVRISDVGKSAGPEVAANARQSKPDAQQKSVAAKPTTPKPATPAARKPETELVADWVETLEPSADGKTATKGPQNIKPIAGTKRVAKKPATVPQDPFLAGPNASKTVDRLSNETLPDDAAPVAKTADAPRPPKSNAKQLVAKQVQAVADKQPAATPDADRLVRGSSHERQRANVLMERAYAMYRSGYPEEALRLASVAAELEKSKLAVYRKGEERPTDFITWLQSADGGRSASPPVIRPQHSNGERTADILTQPADSNIATTSVATPTKRPLGEILRADGDSVLQPRTASARTNAGMEVLAPETSRFPNNNDLEQSASANSPQIAAPNPPYTRNPDAAVAVSHADGPRFDSLSVNDAPSPPADSPQIEPQSGSNVGPSLAASVPPAEKPTPAAATEAQSTLEPEALVQSEAPGLIPLRTTQLTLVGIIGLLTGVAGMAGLSWWHVQERRHFGAKTGAAGRG